MHNGMFLLKVFLASVSLSVVQKLFIILCIFLPTGLCAVLSLQMLVIPVCSPYVTKEQHRDLKEVISKKW